MQIKGFLWLAAALSFALSGCQSAKKPATSLAGQPQNSPPISIPARSASAHTSAPSLSPAAPAAPPQAQSQKPETKTKPDPVTELIAKVESEYQAGLEKSSAGQNDAAKEHFDRAFKMLMGSPSEMRSDPQFQHEFDRVQDGVNKLEAAALPPAPHNATEKIETEEAQKSEPAPIDEANEVTNYPADPNLKAKVKAEVKATRSDLPLMMTDQVAGYINYFSTRGRGTLEHALVRSGRYREMIERTLREEGVPQDLIYLAQAESGFHPYAVSRAGARGIWQFMGSRARGYDLHHDLWMDERQDPEKSTRAAARHLKDLYNQFGDWYLAMAAYNSGPGTVQSAVKRTGYADFWELYRRNVLPKETRNYVPIIVAVTIMAKNPSQYGLDSITPDPPMAYDTVKISYPVDLRLVADCVGASPEELQDLNPSLLRMSTPRLTNRDHFDLHLPIGTSAKYQTAIAAIPPDMRLWWRYYTVTPGDTLMSVARKYRTTTRTIADVNQLEASADLEAGAKLVIPVSPGKHGSGEVEAYAKRTTVYRIRKNDTVQTVSDNLGISPLTIRRWNGLKSNSLSGRRVLYVHLPVSPTAAASERTVAHKSRSSSKLRSPKQSSPGGPVRHTVKPGETLYSIANNYKTSVSAIKQTNTNVAILRPVMVLIIPAR
jgi:membrane-bound lytic murein transglycosylase D